MILKSAAHNTEPQIIRAAARLREAIDDAGGDATIAIMAPANVSDAFRAFVETVRLTKIEHDALQTHMDDEVRKLEEDAKP